PPVGRHHFGGEKTVDGQAVLADQETDPSAQGDPAQTDARRVAEPGREPVAAGRLGVLPGREAGLGPGSLAGGVDLQTFHTGEVDDDSAAGRGQAGEAVAAAFDGDLVAVLGGEGHDSGEDRKSTRLNSSHVKISYA